MSYYVVKNGRTLSDFADRKQAERMVREVGGTIMEDIWDTPEQKKFSEEVHNMGEGWMPCSDECYPDVSDDAVVIAIWKMTGEGEKWRYYMYDDCPYGWNVLTRNKAYWMKLNEPFISE